LLAGWSDGSLDRLSQILGEHGLGNVTAVDSIAAFEALPGNQVGLAVLPIEAGFETDGFSVVAEQDILGDRLVRRAKRRRKSSDIIAEAASLTSGDIVVH